VTRRVAIVGGGPTGMALALALRQQGVAGEIFEARTREAVRRDARILALSHGARQILERLGAWPANAATPIGTIHVSHRGGLGRTLLHAAELDVPALGYVLPASELIVALDAAVQKSDIVYRENAKVGPSTGSGQAVGGTAPDGFALTAWAEGAVDPESARTRDYGQHAVLCTVSMAAPHAGVAWERFTDDGPVALLPLGQGYAVVLTVDSSTVDEVLALDEADFLRVLQARFGGRHRFVGASPRVAYALGLRWRDRPVAERQVWLGNAAQTLHPVAGQGFNLALRDLWELSRHLAAAEDIGAPLTLETYARSRQFDRRGAIGFTDLLIDAFATDFALVRHARGAGLLALDLLPPLRNFVARRMMFGARVWP
jgi:2-octaprenyl-6-methoxyphenol hydroxylase